MRLPKWLQPIKDQTLRAARQVLRQPPRAPTLEEFVSPLREELKTQLAVKPDIGYNEHCANCRSHKTIDQRMATAIDECEDPQPWLASLHGELLETRTELRDTRAVRRRAMEEPPQPDPLAGCRWHGGYRLSRRQRNHPNLLASAHHSIGQT
jgi:hypothetical protein